MKRNILTILGSLALLTACGKFPLGNQVDREKVMDGVKLISPSIPNDTDASAMLQNDYVVSDQQRLLLRYEAFSASVSQVITSDQTRVNVTITLKDEKDSDVALKSMQLCPLNRDWMMAATWSWAVPAPGGRWTQAGGDFDPKGCLNAAPSVIAPIDKALIIFDVTNWVKDYAYGRNQNYGLILISKAPIKIYGDGSAYQAPKLKWQEYAVAGPVWSPSP